MATKKVKKTKEKTAKKTPIRKKAVDKKTTIKVTAEKVPVTDIKKPKLAIVSLTSCEGCQFVLLDLGQKFLDLANKVEMVDFRLLEDEEDSGGSLDLVLVEGVPVTKDNVKLLESVRKRAKILVALGNCAAMGGIPEMKNYQQGANTIKHVYRYIHGISNPAI